MDYIFDGTFMGLLTAVFEAYERKHKGVKVNTSKSFSAGLFSGQLSLETDLAKATRVWKGLKLRIGAEQQKHFYSAFFADDIATWQLMFDYTVYIFNNPTGVDQNYGNPLVLGLSQIAKKVSRERHRMKAFIRFEKGGNGLFHAVVAPDFNVLPLIAKHFKDRYADQPWMIYDERRRYGIHYDLLSVQEVTLEPAAIDAVARSTDIVLDEKEELYATLWKDYFKSTNIKERKNMKLHIQHVPKRYWRYLTEKEID